MPLDDTMIRAASTRPNTYDPATRTVSAVIATASTLTDGLDAIVFATAMPIGHGVRTDGDNPLGEVTPIQGTSDVSFRPCGAENAEIIPASSIRIFGTSYRKKLTDSPRWVSGERPMRS